MYIKSKLYLEDIKRTAGLNLPWEKLRDKTVLLTGASGLIGTFFVDLLTYKNSADNLSIKILALGRNEEKAKKRFGDYWQDKNFRFIPCDVNEPLTTIEKADFIIHGASNTHPALYASDPVGSLTANVLGTLNLLDYAKNVNAERFTFISSVEIYGEALNADDTFDERYMGYIDCNQFRAAYPEGKRAGEALCAAYAEKYGLDVAIPRLSRVYGATMRLDDSKAMSQFIINGVRGEDIVLKSKGNQRFSYCYVADAVAGILYVMLKGKSGEAYNIADNDAIPLKEITKRIAELTGKRVIFDLPKSDEQKGFSKVTVGVMNTDKVKGLGFSPYDDVKSGVEKTIRMLREL